MVFVLVGLMLLFMAVIEYLRVRRGLGLRFVPDEVAERLRPPTGEGGARAGEPPPAIGAGEVGSR